MLLLRLQTQNNCWEEALVVFGGHCDSVSTWELSKFRILSAPRLRAHRTPRSLPLRPSFTQKSPKMTSPPNPTTPYT
eukprot:scaffold3284_cov103-Skeletonema_marinoi.AAC.5